MLWIVECGKFKKSGKIGEKESREPEHDSLLLVRWNVELWKKDQLSRIFLRMSSTVSL